MAKEEPGSLKGPENYVQGLKQIGGGSASGGERKETTAVTPAGSLDPKIAEALAGLGKEDRTMVDSQKYCAVMTNSLLGSMGTPQAWVSPNGVVHLVFGSGEEISHCSSSDNGKGFSKPTVAFRVPNLTIDAEGLVSTVWRRGREIFVATNDGSEEQLIGDVEQPWITSTADGSIVVWSSRRDGELMLKKVSEERMQSISSNARDAVVVAEPVKGKTAFVFWEQNESGRSTIFAKTVEVAGP